LRSFADGLPVGLLWVVLTLACEWHFGHDLMGRSWAGAAAEYNLLHGGRMPVGLAIFAMTPEMAWRLREASRSH